MHQTTRKFQAAVGIAALAILAACAPPSYVITTPARTGITYGPEAAASKAQVALVDERAAQPFSTGILPAALIFNGAPLDPMNYLATHVTEELKARGLGVVATAGGKELPKVHIRTFKMINSRTSGFAPFYSHTYLEADVESSAGTRRIGIFVQGDKVPVWSFKEVIEPVFNQPMTVVTQELASKIANILYSYKASDAQVKALAARVSDTASQTRYLDTYALGFSNNLAAVGKLVELLTDPDDYVRLAAISSLGTVQAKDQIKLLKGIYESSSEKTLWQEKAMAIKAIGDLDTEEAREYLKAQMKKLGAEPPSVENGRMSQVMMLYYHN